MSACQLITYESWDLAIPEIPSRSHLFYLELIGVGTPYVESLTSYVARLAEAHCVPTGILIMSELAPLIKKGYVFDSKSPGIGSVFGAQKNTHTLNGIGVISSALVQALQALTLRNDLRFLTMLTWADVLPWRGLVRAVKAWCPICYQNWQTAESVLYEPLIWTLDVVKMCPRHYQRLQTRCIHCHKQSYLLTGYSRPGYCSYCQEWLGFSSTTKASNSEVLEAAELRQQLWVIRNIGDLFTAAPRLLLVPSKERITKNIVTCINQITAGNRSAFARLLGLVQSDDVWSWYSGENKPPLSKLLLLCDIIGTSLLDFLTIDIVTIDTVKLTTQTQGKPQHQPRKPRRPRRRFDPEQVQQVLQAALNQFPPKPFADVLRQLGKSSKPFVSRHFPDLCHSISSRYADYKKALLEQERFALEAVLESDEYPPPSLREVARRLGSEHNHLNAQFPDICRAISKRYLSYLKARGIESKEKLRQQVRQVSLELHARGQMPHGEKMGELLPKPGVMRNKEAQTALREARRELGYDK